MCMKLCGEQQHFVLLWVQYHKAALRLFMEMLMGKKKYSSYGLMEFSTGMQDEYSIMGFIAQITHMHTHIHMGWEVKETERQSKR